MTIDDLKNDLLGLISYGKSLGEDEEECFGNLEYVYNVLFNNEQINDNLFSPSQEKNEHLIGIIGCCADYAYDEKLKERIDTFYKKAYNILIN